MPDCPQVRCLSPRTMIQRGAKTSCWLFLSVVPGAALGGYVLLMGWVIADGGARFDNERATQDNEKLIEQAGSNMATRAGQDHCGTGYPSIFNYNSRCFFPGIVIADVDANTTGLEDAFTQNLHCDHVLHDDSLKRLCIALTEIAETCLGGLQDEAQEANLTWPIIIAVLTFVLVTVPFALCCIRERQDNSADGSKTQLLG